LGAVPQVLGALAELVEVLDGRVILGRAVGAPCATVDAPETRRQAVKRVMLKRPACNPLAHLMQLPDNVLRDALPGKLSHGDRVLGGERLPQLGRRQRTAHGVESLE
jgi:hypothetical protein